jgi:hypothetical protein
MKLNELLNEIKVNGVVDIDKYFDDLETDVFFTLLVDYPSTAHDAPGFKSETLPIDKLLPTQEFVEGTKSKNSDDIIVVERDGKHFIIDGHHRYARDLKNKKTEMTCTVLHFPKNHVGLEWFEKQLGDKLTRDENGIVRFK